jgi:hypothetical protein
VPTVETTVGTRNRTKTNNSGHKKRNKDKQQWAQETEQRQTTVGKAGKTLLSWKCIACTYFCNYNQYIVKVDGNVTSCKTIHVKKQISK